jgi:hypothetical protein
MKSGNDRGSDGYPKGLTTGIFPPFDRRLNAKSSMHLRDLFIHFFGRFYGADITYAGRPTSLFFIRHFSWVSLDLSHGQPARVCGEVIAHRDIRDHMEQLCPLATYTSGSCLWPS